MSLVQFAHANGRAFATTLSREEQKSLGQFMTPPAIATFMARRLVAPVQSTQVRLLEPAAGAGILAAAVVEELLAKVELPQLIELVLFELDARLVPALHQLCQQMTVVCKASGVQLQYRIEAIDFLLSDMALSGQPIDGLLIIANPPYFKLGIKDARAVAHSYAVYGQPNIYGLFMAACARLVDASGRWCFITPRSWMNGAYFAAVRRTIFTHVRPESLHSFESRTAHFDEDTILQEAVITWATGRAEVDPTLQVLITRSQGIRDLEGAPVQALPMTRLIGDDEHQMVALPGDHDDPFENWSATLATYGLRVSTGPIVAFRAVQYICEAPEVDTVPLLWLQNVQNNRVLWPAGKKREHIQTAAMANWQLVPNVPMVFLRRFSPTEYQRRVTAAGYCGNLPGAVLGLENHLNYIYRPGGQMTTDEAIGLAAFLNSRCVEEHFRARAGSTQVNAAELRKLTFPPIDQIIQIGQLLPANPSTAQVDELVDEILGLAVPLAALQC